MEELGFNEPVSLNQPLKFQEHVHAKFMKYLKENYAGSYDGKLAAAVAKKVFV